jgi:hypothetical protein
VISAGNPPALDDPPLWEPRPGVGGLAAIEGYSVQAVAGPLGEVIASSDDRGRGYVIAAGSPSPKGSSRIAMLPIGLIERIDSTAGLILVGCTVAEIADAPAYENDRYQDAAYRAELEEYYRPPAAFRHPLRG